MPANGLWAPGGRQQRGKGKADGIKLVVASFMMTFSRQTSIMHECTVYWTAASSWPNLAAIGRHPMKLFTAAGPALLGGEEGGREGDAS